MLTRLKKLSLIVCLAMSTPVWAKPVLIKSEKNIEEYQLENGLRVVLAPIEKENKIYLNMIYKTGSLNDPKGKGGLAHLLEHLAFKGTKNIPGAEFQRRLDQFTLNSNAMTEYYTTRYINILRPEKAAIDNVLQLEAERMDKLVLQEKYVPSEISIVMREREVRMDQPFTVLSDQILKSAYGNQYLGRLPVGDLNELKSIKMSELNQFYQTWYAPNNAVLVIAGKFNKSDVLAAIDKNFSPLKAKTIPQAVKVPAVDFSKVKQREFQVKKGSDYARYHLYFNKADSKIKTALGLAPLLFTMQPSGHLYKDIVETGTATAVQASTWFSPDFNLLFLGAIYAPNHDTTQVSRGLNQAIEKTHQFNEKELNRVKSLYKNSIESMMSSASAVGSLITEYIVSEDGHWEHFSKDLKEMDGLSPAQLNHSINQFLKPEYRFIGDIQPTPEDQKKAQQLQESAELKQPLDQVDTKEEPLKDAASYRKETVQYVQTSKQYIEKTEKKIQRGQLKNGMKYAFFPVSTRDDKTYATIKLNFGTAETLQHKEQLLDQMAYLLLRASKQYSLQDIADHAIDAGGVALASSSNNGMVIQISAKKEKFEEFFKFIMGVMKDPLFEQSQFDLIKSQTLSVLNRPYTEPDTVAGMTLSRILEKYEPGDLRYHFEPDLAVQEIQATTRDQVKNLYDTFFTTQYGMISITGDYDAKVMKKYLDRTLGDYKRKQPYARLSAEYRQYPAQQHHVLAEQREFGSYIGYLSLPVGLKHVDAEALMVLGQILGESQLSSRLAQELREKNHLVYGFDSSIDLNAKENVGSLSITANYTPGKSAQLSQSVQKVLKVLLEKGVTEQEVEAAKANIMKKRVTGLEDERRIHRTLNTQLEEDKTLLSRLHRDQAFARLTKVDIDAVIQKYIKLDQLVEVMADQYGQPADTVKK